MRAALFNSQLDDGNWQAPEDDEFGTVLGAIGTTAATTLALEVYYRYLPVAAVRSE